MEKTAVRQKVQRDSVEIRFTKLETALPYLATKADLADVRTELKQDIANVRTELKQDIANVRTELKADIADVRTELACTKSELKDAINSQTKWFMGIIVSVLVSTIGILLKLSSH
ncbi:hypothetical protein Q7M48_05490 (plasmid) [Candidatus Liberibacter asiaticus]|uniref:hypothetical protein n=1 Tax=Liberibacter asiaticus TaxID=34021 RepID=UPI0004D8BA7B|nr:hypothetical protein [Candidatus Liberibacter asiaticus]APD21499.1 hypothetical protein PHHCA_gp24 [Liberibacter phage HHCA1-2]ALK07725.2 hypothetical protein CD16_05485 [Candidatus Liberibacter asiaticus]KAE9517047.1 hypothetical protein FXW24_05420 [Candidatus Liberibacter asiaticus]QNF77000.1 hypothetical protein FML99_05555 [Candidatus Liberibacter asiaticus]UCZ51290.1 hypothetical protein GE519_05550 [Candidatus Liberibacter asiaticus]